MSKDIEMGNGLIGLSVIADDTKSALIVSNLSKKYEIGETFNESLTQDQIICVFTFQNEKSIDTMIHSLLEAKVCFNLKRPLTPEERKESSDPEGNSRLIDAALNLYHQAKEVIKRLDERIKFLEYYMASKKEEIARQSYIAGREFGRYEMCLEYMRSQVSKKPLSQEEWLEKIK